MGLCIKRNKIGKNVAGRSELLGCRKPRVLTYNGFQRADENRRARGVRFEHTLAQKGQAWDSVVLKQKGTTGYWKE